MSSIGVADCLRIPSFYANWETKIPEEGERIEGAEGRSEGFEGLQKTRPSGRTREAAGISELSGCAQKVALSVAAVFVLRSIKKNEQV
jgi:hypothetical protein